MIDGDTEIGVFPLGVGRAIKISIGFGRNMNDRILINPSRTISSISRNITSLKSGNVIGFRCTNVDGIPPRNIRSFGLFDLRMSDFLTGANFGMAQQKAKVKTLKAT